jgi:peptidoglycan hydrolase-like protein with peptidoglycan-binding domain
VGQEVPREPALTDIGAPEGGFAVLARRVGNHATQQLLQRLVQDQAQTHPTLRRTGVEGPERGEVVILQTRLNEDGADPALDVDGVFGSRTETAVKAFQTRHGLAVDGVVGIRTWGLLDELATQGIAGPTSTVLDETTPVTQAQHDAVEQILHPGLGSGSSAPEADTDTETETETDTESGPETTTVPEETTDTPVDSTPTPPTSPAMTDTGPGNAYETEMIAALDTLAADTIARPVTTPAVDMAHANRVADLAKREVERYFGATIALASRRPSGDWHPGSSRMGLADATTRPVDEGDILGWTDYFMDNGSYPPAAVGSTHHYDNTRARPDRAEHDRVRAVWLNGGGRDKVRQMIRAWPAEASTGTVFLQLRDPMYQTRVGMWLLFQTMIHEFMHLVTHPNYGRVADAIGGGARDILIEGMDDHMTMQVWDDIRPRIATDDSLRATVEGPFHTSPVVAEDYEADSEIDQTVKGSHYDSMGDADRIAEEVGEGNARAAFFMGHVEALGLGASSSGEQSLTGMAFWRADAGGEPDEYVVRAGGETLEQILEKTGAGEVQDASGTTYDDPSHHFAAGETLQIPGLRWHTTIAEDTLGQVANQHGVTLEALERANGLPHRRGSQRVPDGTLLMIPVAP